MMTNPRPEDSAVMRKDIMCQALKMTDSLRITEEGPIRVMPEKVETRPWWLTNLDWSLPTQVCKAVAALGQEMGKNVPAPLSVLRNTTQNLPAKIEKLQQLPIPMKENKHELQIITKETPVIAKPLPVIKTPPATKPSAPVAKPSAPVAKPEPIVEEEQGPKLTLEMLLDPNFDAKNNSY
jgi:hypothetical protein